MRSYGSQKVPRTFFFFPIGKLETELIKALKQEQPDIIVITGDLATPGGNSVGYKKLLKHFHAPQGVYFIRGNWEYWKPIEKFDSILKETHIINLTNKIKNINNNIYLVGFDDSEEGNPDLKLLKKLPKEGVKIALFHSPSLIDSIAGKIQLALAGHTHGGQIRLPFIGALVKPGGTGKYIQGLYKIDNSYLYVSKGIGTSILPIRFFCSPELAIFEIKPR